MESSHFERIIHGYVSMAGLYAVLMAVAHTALSAFHGLPYRVTLICRYLTNRLYTILLIVLFSVGLFYAFTDGVHLSGAN